MAPEALFFFSLPILKLGHVRSTWHKLGWLVFLGVPPPPLEGSSALFCNKWNPQTTGTLFLSLFIYTQHRAVYSAHWHITLCYIDRLGQSALLDLFVQPLLSSQLKIVACEQSNIDLSSWGVSLCWSDSSWGISDTCVGNDAQTQIDILPNERYLIVGA